MKNSPFSCNYRASHSGRSLPASGDLRRAFTLLELCIVVAVIGCLFVLSMGAVSKIKQSADITKCLGNLKQFGSAILSYTADYKGQLPENQYLSNSSNPDSGRLMFFQAIAPYGGFTYPIINPGIFRKSILACPAEVVARTSVVFCYGLNVDLDQLITGNAGWADKSKVRLQNIQNASTYVLMSDTYGTCAFYTHTKVKMQTYSNATRRHGGFPNFLYADGHVESYRDPLVGWGDSGGSAAKYQKMWYADGIAPSRR